MDSPPGGEKHNRRFCQKRRDVTHGAQKSALPECSPSRHRRNNMSAEDGHVLLVVSTRGGGKSRHDASPLCLLALRSQRIKVKLKDRGGKHPINNLTEAFLWARRCSERREQAKFKRPDKLKYLRRDRGVCDRTKDPWGHSRIRQRFGKTNLRGLLNEQGDSQGKTVKEFIHFLPAHRFGAMLR